MCNAVCTPLAVNVGVRVSCASFLPQTACMHKSLDIHLLSICHYEYIHVMLPIRTAFAMEGFVVHLLH